MATSSRTRYAQAPWSCELDHIFIGEIINIIKIYSQKGLRLAYLLSYILINSKALLLMGIRCIFFLNYYGAAICNMKQLKTRDNLHKGVEGKLIIESARKQIDENKFMYFKKQKVHH